MTWNAPRMARSTVIERLLLSWTYIVEDIHMHKMEIHSAIEKCKAFACAPRRLAKWNRAECMKCDDVNNGKFSIFSISTFLSSFSLSVLTMSPFDTVRYWIMQTDNFIAKGSASRFGWGALCCWGIPLLCRNHLSETQRTVYAAA